MSNSTSSTDSMSQAQNTHTPDDIVPRLRKTRAPLELEAAREILKLRRLLDRVSIAIPDYMDGRNDRLLDAIDRATSTR